MDEPVLSSSARRDAIAVYKTILKDVLDQRPSGMRNRLAEALGKNRSFISHITSPAYDTPIPASHLKTIFGLCHFSRDERRRFLDAYRLAHPRSREAEPRVQRPRHVSVRLPDFGNEELNSRVEQLLQTLADEIGRTFARNRTRKATKERS